MEVYQCRDSKIIRCERVEEIILLMGQVSQKYLKWIVNRYLVQDFNLEDLKIIKSYIADFDRMKQEKTF